MNHVPIGSRLRVYWPLEQCWFKGTVWSVDGRRHKVVYDDGDKEKLDLRQEKYELLDAASASAPHNNKVKKEMKKEKTKHLMPAAVATKMMEKVAIKKEKELTRGKVESTAVPIKKERKM